MLCSFCQGYRYYLLLLFCYNCQPLSITYIENDDKSGTADSWILSKGRTGKGRPIHASL